MLQEELKKRGIPDLLTFENGEKVTAETWPRRREEILRVLKSELYGELPELSFRQSCAETGGEPVFHGREGCRAGYGDHD